MYGVRMLSNCCCVLNYNSQSYPVFTYLPSDTVIILGHKLLFFNYFTVLVLIVYTLLQYIISCSLKVTLNHYTFTPTSEHWYSTSGFVNWRFLHQTDTFTGGHIIFSTAYTLCLSFSPVPVFCCIMFLCVRYMCSGETAVKCKRKTSLFQINKCN